MQNYPFDFNTLFKFSNSDPYLSIEQKYSSLFDELNTLKENLNFPAVNNDVGTLIGFIVQLLRPKVVFEMGSGYGHSLFWYLQSSYDFYSHIYLTEKRSDLLEHFNSLPWPEGFRSKVTYFQGDAFELIKSINEIDFLLIDGVKSDYLRFLDNSYERLSDNAIIMIDNSYWRGSFLDEDYQEKKSAKSIKELHKYLKDSGKYQSAFLPYKDGVSLLRKLPS